SILTATFARYARQSRRIIRRTCSPWQQRWQNWRNGLANMEPLQSPHCNKANRANSELMWKFRISCFASLGGLLWLAAVASPFQTVEGSLSFLPVLAVLGI